MIYPSKLAAVTACLVLSSPSSVLGHMAMLTPPPFNAQNNPNAADIDYNLKAPLDANGDNFPCKGAHTELGSLAGKPVATWAAGTLQSFTLASGGAYHMGGSCQASISEDLGKTFKVVKSYIGQCPTSSDGGTFDFIIPKEAKSGEAIFAWTWFNRMGNREMYMNCAPIEIISGGGGLFSYPDIFVANIGNSCSTLEGSDVIFPNPGIDVDNKSDKPAPPQGNCGEGSGGGAQQPPPPVLSPSPPSPSVDRGQTSTPQPSQPEGGGGGSSSSTTSTTASESSSSAEVSTTSPTSMAVLTAAMGDTVPACICTCGGPGGYIVHIAPLTGEPGVINKVKVKRWFL